ncbi:hypothetical protein [Sphingorhabdus lutea]|nr:hypothetical protein [Sphingorhabdus lutea]
MDDSAYYGKEFVFNYLDIFHMHDYNLDEFVSPNEVLDRLKQVYPDKNPVGMLIYFAYKLLLTGVTGMVYFRCSTRDNELECEDYEEFNSWLHDAAFFNGFQGRYNGPFIVCQSFWNLAHAKSFGDWVAGIGSSDEWVTSNWKTGIFGLATKNSGCLYKDLPITGDLTLYGIKFLRSDLDLIAPMQAEPPKQKVIEKASRATKYDWEAAFAYVVAAFHHDIGDFEPEKLGANKEMVDLLRHSFIVNNLDVPEDAALKAKAKIILGNINSYKRPK